MWSIVRKVAAIAVLMTLMMPAAAPAQPSPPPPPRSYVLGTGDTISVVVAGNDDLARTVTVGADGRVALPLIGIVAVGGLTGSQLEARLTQLYRQYIRNPQVTVTIVQFRRIKVTLLGQVRGPGPHDLPYGATVLDAIGVAGGIVEGAAAGQAYVIRSQREILPVNIGEILAGNGRTNLVLQDGDVIVVPSSAPVYVLGEVARPGAYQMKDDMTLLDVLLQAGGLTDKASITDARLLRNRSEVVPVNLDGLLLKADLKHNIPMQAGDILFVPEDVLGQSRVYVLGQVGSPGAYPFRTARTVFQAISAAGGPTQKAALRNAHIIRRKTAGDQAQGQGNNVIPVNLEALLRGDLSKDIPMREGDVLYIPESTLSTISTFLQNILSILSGIATLIFIFR